MLPCLKISAKIEMLLEEKCHKIVSLTRDARRSSSFELQPLHVCLELKIRGHLAFGRSFYLL